MFNDMDKKTKASHMTQIKEAYVVSNDSWRALLTVGLTDFLA